MSSAPIRVFVSAGEASSDAHAAGLVGEMKNICPAAEFFGMGGSALRLQGVETLVDSETTASVMGLVEVLGSVRRLHAALRMLVTECERRKPAIAVLVDFPDFNMLLARRLHRLGIKVFYFVAPQLWAWRTGRVKTIARCVRRVAPIFPFEEEFFLAHGIDARYVGHPFVSLPPVRDAEDIRGDLGLAPPTSVIALLPGSRRSEISRLLVPMVEGFQMLKQDFPELQAYVPLAPNIGEQELRAIVPEAEDVHFFHGPAREVLSIARAAVVASGTATVEAALAGHPFVVVYRLAPLTHAIARALVRGVKNFAMPNLIAGRRVVPELLQSEVSGQRIASELRALLSDEDLYRRTEADLKDVSRRLGANGSTGANAYRNAAVFAAELISEV